MKTIPVLRTATHPADPAQALVLVSSLINLKRSDDSICTSCAIALHCKARFGGAVMHPAVYPRTGSPHNCVGGVWITIEEYVGWHQKEDTS